MSKLKKIMRTVIIFLLSMFVICFLFSLYKVWTNEIVPTQILNETGLYFLYTIGYGALEGDSVIQNILAMVGIISLALMTTFLTINLFWRLDDVKLRKDLFYEKGHLYMQFQNKGRAICDMKVTFVLYDEKTTANIEEPKEYYMPVLVKHSIWNLTFDLNETFWYKTVYDLLTLEDKKLYCVFSFVDTVTGQSSIKVEEITKENLRADQGLLEYQEFIKPMILPHQELIAIENNGNLQLEIQPQETIMDYSFSKKADDNAFVMAYYSFHDAYLNLEKFNRETTYLETKMKSDDAICLKIEIKLSNNNQFTKIIPVHQEEKNVRIDWKELPEHLDEVKEICYTIFKKENQLTGTLEIGDLKIITK